MLTKYYFLTSYFTHSKIKVYSIWKAKSYKFIKKIYLKFLKNPKPPYIELYKKYNQKNLYPLRVWEPYLMIFLLFYFKKKDVELKLGNEIYGYLVDLYERKWGSKTNPICQKKQVKTSFF